MSKINNIAVVGAGTMGLGIAQVCALSGYVVKLFDLNEKSLQTAEQKINVNLNKGIEKGKISKQQKSEGLKNLNFTHNFNDLKADLFIEAVVEKLEVKIQLFNQLMENNGDTAIYASNTSSIPLSQIAGKCKFPEKVIGIHFFNPAHIMKLVEIIKPAQADKALIRNTKSFVKSIGKVPILVQDSPGFVVNRVARHFYVESLKVLEDGVDVA